VDKNRDSLSRADFSGFYALERQARRARAVALGRFITAGLAAVARALSPAAAAVRAEVKQHA